MPLQPFDQLFPEIARQEMRVYEANTPEFGVPQGRYVLREFYCTDIGCDCRRVLIQLLPVDRIPEVAASINYGWEKAQYYRKWSRDPELWREMAGATLERLAEQGPHARKFLKAFQQLIQDRSLAIVFRRHYRLVKEVIAPPDAIRDHDSFL